MAYIVYIVVRPIYAVQKNAGVGLNYFYTEATTVSMGYREQTMVEVAHDL